jgi:hypothetical protein
VGEIGGAGRSTTNNRQRRGAETDRIEGKPKAKTLRAQGWSILPIVIGDSSDIDSNSLGESAFFLSERGVLLLKEAANQGIVLLILFGGGGGYWFSRRG